MQNARTAAHAVLAATLMIPAIAAQSGEPAASDDRRVVAEIDRLYQAAVERNDAATMDRILHEDFVLVLGDGRTFTRTDLLEAARTRKVEYERQVEVPGTQVVRVHGDTAVVTALLWERFTYRGERRDQRLWFTDTYVRTPAGWKYWFGQASLPLPASQTGADAAAR